MRCWFHLATPGIGRDLGFWGDIVFNLGLWCGSGGDLNWGRAGNAAKVPFNLYKRFKNKLSDFDVQFVKRSLDRFRALKDKFRRIKSGIQRCGIFDSNKTRIYIHRLAPAESTIILNQSPAYGKIPPPPNSQRRHR